MKTDPMIMAFMQRHCVSGKPGKYAAMIQDLQQLWTDARAEPLELLCWAHSTLQLWATELNFDEPWGESPEWQRLLALLAGAPVRMEPTAEELLADNEHLRTALAASVAANVVYEDLEGAYDKALEVLRRVVLVANTYLKGGSACPFCKDFPIHSPQCPISDADALLAKPGAAGGSTGDRA